jgi:glucosamine--fructose-6-phosphate aminotransferase (isomerizing)
MTGDDRVAQFRADIEASPEALATLLAEAPPTPVPADGRICLTGLGSSRYAADIVAGAWRAQGRTAWSELASGEQRTRPAADLTLIAISASGGTPEVVDAARRHRGTSRVIAVTNRADSALAAAADDVVLLHAGTESSGIACRTFRATLAVLHLLGGGSRLALQPLPDALAARLPRSTDWATGAADAIDGAPAIDVLADAGLSGLAEQAALMLREAPRLPAHAGDTADWLHVGVYLAWPGHVVVRYPGSAADAELERTLQARGVRLLDVPGASGRGAGEGGDPIARAIVTSIDAELLAHALWSRASAETQADDKGT